MRASGRSGAGFRRGTGSVAAWGWLGPLPCVAAWGWLGLTGAALVSRGRIASAHAATLLGLQICHVERFTSKGYREYDANIQRKIGHKLGLI